MAQVISFPMYDAAPLRPKWEALWSALRPLMDANGLDLPQSLVWPKDLESHWRDPGLMLSQSCMGPIAAGLKVTVLGTLDFGLPGCPPGFYNSVVVARHKAPLETFAGKPWARNAETSQSGNHALLAAIGPHALGEVLETGSHAKSIKAVQADEAALAAIDAQTWRVLSRLGQTEGLETILRTPPTPGLPLITAPGQPAEAIKSALVSGFACLSASVLEPLDIKGFCPLP